MNTRIYANDPLLDASATELSKLIRGKQVSPVELMERTLSRIELLKEENLKRYLQIFCLYCCFLILQRYNLV